MATVVVLPGLTATLFSKPEKRPFADERKWKLSGDSSGMLKWSRALQCAMCGGYWRNWTCNVSKTGACFVAASTFSGPVFSM